MRLTKVSLAAIATAAALALSACGGGSSSSASGAAVNGSGKSLDVLVGTKSDAPAQQKQWMSDIASKFKQQTGADLKFETASSADEELTKLQTSAVSGQGPDVYELGTTMTPTAYATGSFLTLTADDWKKIGGKDRFNQAALGISGPDQSHLIGIPFSSAPYVMAYNKEMLKAAGIDKPATTWDGLAEQAKKLTDPAKGQYGMAIAYKDNYDPWKYIWDMAAQAGNTMVDGKTAKIDDPTVKSAYQTYFGWLTKDKVVNPASVGWSNSQALADFASGRDAYFLMTSSDSMPTLDKSPIAGKWDYALMPTTAGAQAASSSSSPVASILSGDNLMVANYSKNRDLALAYINLVTSKDEQLNYQKIFGDLPTNADALAALGSAPHMAALTQAAKESQATPFTGAWGDIEVGLLNVVVQSIPDLASGGVSDSSLMSRIKDAQSKSQQSLARTK